MSVVKFDPSKKKSKFKSYKTGPDIYDPKALRGSRKRLLSADNKIFRYAMNGLVTLFVIFIGLLFYMNYMNITFKKLFNL